MTADSATWMLLALGSLIVLLTRVRLGRSPSGHEAIPRTLLNLHTFNGLIAAALSVVYLLGHDRNERFGWIIVGLWILEATIGLMILVRWMPVHGRHATRIGSDGWTDGPWLSIFAHVGMAAGVGLLTWLFATGQI